MRLFSCKKRPSYLGPYPLERLPRTDQLPDFQLHCQPTSVTFADPARVTFADPTRPYAVSNAMTAYMELFNKPRDGEVAPAQAPIPDHPTRRAQNLKGSCYFVDASMVGICEIPEAARGESAESCRGHTHAVAIRIEYTRDPRVGEPGEDWIRGTQALPLVDKTGERVYEAELYRLKGELLLQQSQDNFPDAETCFHKALDVARKQSAKSWELRAAMSLSRLWQQQGKTTEARELLVPVYGWFTEGFDTADRKDAKVLLEELAG